jgi:uncharacterized UPF0160 family protein
MLIVTHDGRFHADEVFAIAAIRTLHSTATFKRTRDKRTVSIADVVVDVGMEYDPSRHRYDHHQKGGAGNRANGAPYASFGLVWEHIVRPHPSMDTQVWELVDQWLVQPIDAEDCGLDFAREGIRPFTVSGVIESFLPSWELHGLTHDKGMVVAQYEHAFQCAVHHATLILDRTVTKAEEEVRAQRLLVAAIHEAEDQRIVELEQKLPWEETLCKESDTALYLVYPSESGEQWNVRAVPPAPGSMDQRKPLPEEWAGQSGEELAQITGVSTAIFCHKNRFLVAATDRKGALQLARLAADS